MWCPVDGGGSAFYARRFAYETAMHRADAALALGAEFTLDLDVAADALDEWMELGCMPFHFEVHPWMRELLAPGRTIGLHATDTDAHWLLDLTGTSSRGGGPTSLRPPTVRSTRLIRTWSLPAEARIAVPFERQ